MFCLCQLRNALGTLASEGFVVIHGDSVKRVWKNLLFYRKERHEKEGSTLSNRILLLLFLLLNPWHRLLMICVVFSCVLKIIMVWLCVTLVVEVVVNYFISKIKCNLSKTLPNISGCNRKRNASWVKMIR